MKKIICLLLIVSMGLFMIPTMVFAAPDDNDELDPYLAIYVGEDEYKPFIDAEDVPEGVTFDSETNTLTLTNFDGTFIAAEDIDLTIVLVGENSLSGFHDGAIVLESGTLTFEGTGSLDFCNPVDDTAGLVSFGKLTINGGALNFSELSEGILSFGELEINDGEINISDAESGIYTKHEDDSNPVFRGNGGTINVVDSYAAFNIEGSFILDGTEIVIDNVDFAVTTDGLVSGSAEINNGSIIIKNSPNTNFVYAFVLGFYLGEAEGPEDLFVFNSDNLYVDSEIYDFRTIEIEEGYVFVIAEEGISSMDQSEAHKLAKNISILPKEKVTYEVTEGDGQKISGSAKDIKIDADLEKFVALYVNDELVGEDSYDLEEGSTIIKLKDGYISNLDAGNYTFRAVFTDGEATGTFTIASEAPATGDSILYSILLFCLSGVALFVLRRRVHN